MNFALLLETLRRHGITHFEKGRSYSVTLTKEEAIKILGEAPRHAVFRVQTLFQDNQPLLAQKINRFEVLPGGNQE